MHLIPCVHNVHTTVRHGCGVACRCGWNCISPDWLTPALAYGTIWSWAPGEPRNLGLSTTVQAAASAASASRSQPTATHAAAASSTDRAAYRAAEQDVLDSGAEGCVAMSALDGRWRTVSCDDALPIACKAVADVAAEGGAVGAAAAPALGWSLGCTAKFTAAGWKCTQRGGAGVGSALSELMGSLRVGGGFSEPGVGGAERTAAACGPGFEVAYPRIAWENMALWRTLADSGEARVMLPLRPGVGPGVEV